MATKLGFIGLGRMGTPIVTNLLAAGYRVAVYDVRPAAIDRLVERGAVAATSPAELARDSDVVFTSLPEGSDVVAVAKGPDGVLSTLRDGGTLVDLTTNSPAVVRELSEQFAQSGRHFVDAPVGGRSNLAASREIQVMVGAPDDVYEQIRPILHAFAKRVVHCGPVGTGSVCKLMHNAINAVFRQSVGECFTTAVKAGVAAEVLWEIVRNGITCGGSEINKTLRYTWLSGAFDTGTGSLRMHHKDTALAVELGSQLGVPMPQTELALRRLDQAIARGWGERDATVSLLIQEELAGIEVRIPDRPAVKEVGES